jgi:hypothetical protein
MTLNFSCSISTAKVLPESKGWSLHTVCIYVSEPHRALRLRMTCGGHRYHQGWDHMAGNLHRIWNAITLYHFAMVAKLLPQKYCKSQ